MHGYNKTQIYKFISCICFIGNQTIVKDDETNGEEKKLKNNQKELQDQL